MEFSEGHKMQAAFTVSYISEVKQTRGGHETGPKDDLK